MLTLPRTLRFTARSFAQKLVPNGFQRRTFIVTIDGPAASGKSTTAKRVAHRLGFQYLDSGSLYRAITLRLLQDKALDHRSTEDHDWERIARAAQVKIQTTQNPTGLKVRTFLDGKDVTNMIRSPWVTENVSVVAQNPLIRQVILDLQHRLAQDPIRPRSTVDLVIDGRDIGTAVFPQAELKIYLVAQARVRAQRRLDELTCQAQIENPMESIPTLDELTKQIETRDQADLTREHSPLRKPSDAVEIDTTQLTIDQQVDRIITLVNARRPKESIQ